MCNITTRRLICTRTHQTGHTNTAKLNSDAFGSYSASAPPSAECPADPVSRHRHHSPRPLQLDLQQVTSLRSTILHIKTSGELSTPSLSQCGHDAHCLGIVRFPTKMHQRLSSCHFFSSRGDERKSRQHVLSPSHCHDFNAVCLYAPSTQSRLVVRCLTFLHPDAARPLQALASTWIRKRTLTSRTSGNSSRDPMPR